MKLARVFPRRTKASPNDPLAFFGPPGLFTPDVDEVHVSVTFTWDYPRAELLARQWEDIAPVKVGGPALGDPGGQFVPGRYLKPGYVITSRGCPNHCWFCDVPRREGPIREQPITDGWNVLDSNLLACSENHIRAVFSMLKRQPERAQFTGGLEAARLKSWHVDLLSDLNPKQMFFAYDTPDDYEPLRQASAMLFDAGFNRQSMRCYVLIGYKGDTLEAADKRLRETVGLGFFPAAMLYRDSKGKKNLEWMKLQRKWFRPAIIYRRTA